MDVDKRLLDYNEQNRKPKEQIINAPHLTNESLLQGNNSYAPIGELINIFLREDKYTGDTDN